MRIAVATMEMDYDKDELYDARFLARFLFEWIKPVFLVANQVDLAFPLKIFRKTWDIFYENNRKILKSFAFSHYSHTPW